MKSRHLNYPMPKAKITKLNDDEQKLISISSSEYMSAIQLNYFEKKLETMRAELLANAQHSLENQRSSEALPDIFDRATHEEELALDHRVRDRERKLLKKIEQAINRIHNHEYGYCEVSGQPIGLKRLIARPTALLCIEEQERHEIRERNFHDPH